MNVFVKYFDKNNHDKELSKNIMKYGTKLKTYLMSNLVVKQ